MFEQQCNVPYNFLTVLGEGVKLGGVCFFSGTTLCSQVYMATRYYFKVGPYLQPATNVRQPLANTAMRYIVFSKSYK